MLKKGCAILVVLFGAVFGAYFWLLRDVEFPGNLILALFGSLGLLMLASALKQIIFGDGEKSALQNALQGAPLPPTH